MKKLRYALHPDGKAIQLRSLDLSKGGVSLRITPLPTRSAEEHLKEATGNPGLEVHRCMHIVPDFPLVGEAAIISLSNPSDERKMLQEVLASGQLDEKLSARVRKVLRDEDPNDHEKQKEQANEPDQCG